MWISHKVTESIRITEIFSFFEDYYEKNFKFSGESHNFWECVYVLKGSICVSADEKVYTLGQNEIIFHKPLEFHKFYIDGDEQAILLIFSFSCEGELSEYLKNKVFFLNEHQQSIITSMISYCREKYNKSEYGRLKAYWCKFNYLKAVKNDLQMVASYMCQLFLSFAESNAPVLSFVSQEAEIFSKAVDYMKSNTSSRFLVSDISKFCGVSESGLKRIFSKFAGIGIHKYFLQIKIKSAVELLESGVSVSETSERLGFSSQGYFSAMFKRETGKSPSQFKAGYDYIKIFNQ